MNNLIDLLQTNSKRLDVSFIANYLDEKAGIRGYIFVYGNKRGILADNGLLTIQVNIGHNGKHLYKDYVNEINFIKTLLEHK